MTAPIPAPPAAPAQEPIAPVTPPAAPAAPPWGTDDQFDATKAWALIEGLRADKEKLSARPVLTAEQQSQLTQYNALVEASKTEAQRLADATELAKTEAATAKADAIRYKAAATHKIGAEHFDLLGTGTEEEVTARAERVAALLAASVPPAVPPAPGAPPTRPIEQLRPGATPAGQPNDDDVIYAQLFGPQK